MDFKSAIFIGLILTVAPLLSWSESPGAYPVLRVEQINKSKEGTEVKLQPMLPTSFSAVVEKGELNKGDVIKCEPAQRAMGTDEQGRKHHIIVLKCGKKILLLRAVHF